VTGLLASCIRAASAARAIGDAMTAWIVATLLLSVRLGVAVGLSPPFASYGLPALVRVALILALSALVAGAVAQQSGLEQLIERPQELLVAVAAEGFIGMALGLGVHVVLAAFALAGRILDVQIGFGIGSIFDPVTRASSNVLASLMSVLGVTLFFVTDSHLALASLVVRSIGAFPLGTWPSFDDPFAMLSASGLMFSAGLALAAPVVLALLMTDVLVGVASRNMPQVNVLVLSIPLKVLIGYAVLALAVTAWAPALDPLFGRAGDLLGARR
jgi:flagellar biosynthesis protein FliR